MIITEILYGAKCDRCSIYYDGEYSFFMDQESIKNELDYSSWLTKDDKHYCSMCYDINEETDEIKVKDFYPECYLLLIAFVRNIIRGSVVRVIEAGDTYLVQFREKWKSPMSIADINYIKELLGKKYVSIEVVEENRRNICYVRFKK